MTHEYVDTTELLNDMHIIRIKNDVLTVLIHLGYLANNKDTYECYIPNKEVADEMKNTMIRPGDQATQLPNRSPAFIVMIKMSRI
ncbi:MAG: hypothetical protein ACI3YM_05935 [Prevotella sp.]